MSSGTDSCPRAVFDMQGTHLRTIVVGTSGSESTRLRQVGTSQRCSPQLRHLRGARSETGTGHVRAVGGHAVSTTSLDMLRGKPKRAPVRRQLPGMIRGDLGPAMAMSMAAGASVSLAEGRRRHNRTIYRDQAAPIDVGLTVNPESADCSRSNEGPSRHTRGRGS